MSVPLNVMFELVPPSASVSKSPAGPSTVPVMFPDRAATVVIGVYVAKLNVALVLLTADEPENDAAEATLPCAAPEAKPGVPLC